MTTTSWWCPQGEQPGGLFDRAHAERDVIKTADWIIDLGPEGGVKGGEIVATGTPEDVVKVERSFTGRYLAPLLRSEGQKIKNLNAAAKAQYLSSTHFHR